MGWTQMTDMSAEGLRDVQFSPSLAASVSKQQEDAFQASPETSLRHGPRGTRHIIAEYHVFFWGVFYPRVFGRNISNSQWYSGMSLMCANIEVLFGK